MLVCPRCNEPLARTKSDKGFVFACPKCRGRAVALAVVRKLAGQACAKEVWRQVSRENGRQGPGCPVCRRSMVEVPVPADGRVVHLDVCKDCRFIWFDPSELEQLPQQTAPPAKREPLPEKVREQMALAEVEMVAKRAQAGDEVTGPDDPWKWIPALLGMPVECDAGAAARPPWATWGRAH